MPGSDSLIPKTIRLLLVEDSRVVVELIRTYLEGTKDTVFHFKHAPDLFTGLQRLEEGETDVVLLDLGLPDSEGLNTFSAFYQKAPHIPIVIFTGSDDKELALTALGMGAKDYLVKSKVDSDLLIRSLYYALERKHFENRLRESEERYRTLVENIGEGVGILNVSKRFLFANPAAARIFGVAEGHLVGRLLTEFTDERNCEIVESQTQNQSEGKGDTYELEITLDDGQRHHVLVTATPRLSHDQRFIGTHGVFCDITEQKRLEEKLIKSSEELKNATSKLIHSEKLSAMGELAASVAHELNQPLNSIKLTAQSIIRYRDQYGEQDLERDLDEIVATVDKTSKIIDHMRTFSRYSMTKEPVDLNKVVERALKFVSEKCQYHDIEITKQLVDDIPFVHGDTIQLEQVVLSLTNNARAALESCDKTNRRMQVKTSFATGEAVDKPRVVLEIADNGIGIPAEIQQKVFEPFYTTKQPGKGTGLGLSICTKIIEDHNGAIELESEEGRGTVFRVSLPVA